MVSWVASLLVGGPVFYIYYGKFLIIHCERPWGGLWPFLGFIPGVFVGCRVSLPVAAGFFLIFFSNFLPARGFFVASVRLVGCGRVYGHA